MFEDRIDSDVANIDYFRKYALPALSRLKDKQYVAVKVFSDDVQQETWSVLIKKEVYKNSTNDQLAEACKFYVDYTPSIMEVTELLETDGDGGKFSYKIIDKDQSGNWIDHGSSVVYARSEESIEREKQKEKETRKIDKEFKEGTENKIYYELETKTSLDQQ
jgi:hypothetical protein